MKNQLAATLTIAAAALLAPVFGMKGGAAYAVTSTLLVPNSVESDIGSAPTFMVENLIYGTRFSNLYDDATDFNTFTTTTTYDISRGDIWVSRRGRTSGFLTFDFGEVVTIEAFALWNDESDSAIDLFYLYGDFRNTGIINEADIGHTLVVGVAERELSRETSAQVFTFTPYSTRYVFLDIDRNFGNRSFVSAAQVAFARSATPIPFEFGHVPGIIFLVAVGGINYFRNQKMVKEK